jgi:ferredoxin-NADP reductase
MSERLPWLAATALETRQETASVKTIVFDVPGWRGHQPGQHVDIRLTAEDGYVAQRSYSIASPGGGGSQIELTVDRIEGGEVSPFLIDELRVGDAIELRGPIGGYFTWSPGRPEPLMLVAGGSGIVPLMSILRTRAAAPDTAPARLLYSSRTAAHIIYKDELERLQGAGDRLLVTHTLTREVPAGWTGGHGRIGRGMLTRQGFASLERATVFVCGPTPFVEAVSDHLIANGHEQASIKTERFGPTGDRK